MCAARCSGAARAARWAPGNPTVSEFAPVAAPSGDATAAVQPERPAAQPERPVILRGGPILTLDGANQVGEALAIRGSEIIGVGSLTEIKRHYTPGTEIVDLAGRAVLPGFVEPHVHVLESAFHAAGLAREAAPQLLEDEPERVAEIGARALRELAMRGCTTVYDIGIGLLAGAAEHRLLGALARAPDAPVRLRGAFTPELATALDVSPDNGDDRYAVVGISYWADGSIQDFTAALREPYLNGRGNGRLEYGQEELCAAMRVWQEAGWQLVVHADGDRATEQVLHCFESLLDGGRGPRIGKPHRIEHFTVVDDEQVARAAELGVTVSHAINQVYYLGESLRDHVLGPERAAYIHSLRRDIDHGLVSSCHTGAPAVAIDHSGASAAASDHGGPSAAAIAKGGAATLAGGHGEASAALIDPCLALRTATTRLMRDSDDVLGPFQQLKLDEALRTLTVHPAHQVLLGDRVGSLRPGMLADLVVLDRDPRDVAPERLHELRVIETWLGGRRQQWG